MVLVWEAPTQNFKSVVEMEHREVYETRTKLGMLSGSGVGGPDRPCG